MNILDLNAECDCLPIARADAEQAILSQTSYAGMPAMLDARENYFARTAVFISRDDLNAMQTQIDAIETAVKTQAYRDMVFARKHNPLHHIQSQTRGAFMGYDFHITQDGPKLIEINTNAGGAFIVNALQQTVGLPNQDSRFVDMFIQDWQRSGRTDRPKTIAIVDENPTEQFHYPDMCLAADMLKRQGFDVIITGPDGLRYDGHKLTAGGENIDLVYNRLTDFDLSEPENAVLHQALADDAAVITPAPRHHALLADKRNLAILSDQNKLAELGVDEHFRKTLSALPATIEVTRDNLDRLWQNRRQYFFKPKAGFGSRAAYRGAKLTKRVWQNITAGGYVAQEFIRAPYRAVTNDGHAFGLKFDVRIYTYDGTPLLTMARVYQGQTTNLRTPGGGLAPVLVIEDSECRNAIPA